MYEVMTDMDGNMVVFEHDDEDDDYRNAKARPSQRARRRRSQVPARRGQRYSRMTRYSPPSQPQYYPQPAYPAPMQPYPGPQQGFSGLDMRTGMKALGAVLPGLGQLVSAFRRTPERPQLTGQGEEDLPVLLDYIADVFTHDRAGDQMTAVLATTGAMLEILGSL